MFILYFDVLLNGQNTKNLIESAVFLGVNLFLKTSEWNKGYYLLGRGLTGMSGAKPQKFLKYDVLRSSKMSISASVFLFYKCFQIQFNDILHK